MDTTALAERLDHWYVVSKDGITTLCATHDDAVAEAEAAQRDYPQCGPYIVTRLRAVAGEPVEDAIGAIIFRDWDASERSEGGPTEFLRGRIRAFVADLLNPQPATPASGWMPIESAPRDGTYVTLRSEMGDDVGCWHDERYCMLGAPQGSFGPGWVDEVNHLPIYAEFEPTHWMPLPATPNPEQPEHPDDAAVDRFAAAMKAKLAQKRAEGRGGWDDPEQCRVEFLSDLLHGHVRKGDPVDVGNLAMMLHQRGSGVLPEQPGSAVQGDIIEAYKSWPEDIRKKLSLHDLRRMAGWVQRPNPEGWGIDTSTGTPILVYEQCSVIESEHARYVLSLVARDTTPPPAPAAEQGDANPGRWVAIKPEGAPYWGIHTEAGATIAGTSSGLSEGDAKRIVALHNNELCEADDLLREWNLNPERFRSEGGWLNAGKIRAALLHPQDYAGLYLTPPADRYGVTGPFRELPDTQPEARGVVAALATDGGEGE